MTIYKYLLKITDGQNVVMPLNAKILTAQTQHGKLCLWALVEPDVGVKETRSIEIFGTGNPIPTGNRAYISTVQRAGGGQAWHVFERLLTNPAAKMNLNAVNQIKTIMKKTLLSILAGTTLAANAVTITVLQDSFNGLDFTIEWGENVRTSPGGGTAVGPGGSKVWWLGMGRNPNAYFVEIQDPSHTVPAHGFGVRFFPDPEYFGPVDTSYGAPNLFFGGPDHPEIYPLAGNPYGARFVYGSPELDGTWAMMSLGLVGIGLATFIDRKRQTSK